MKDLNWLTNTAGLRPDDDLKLVFAFTPFNHLMLERLLDEPEYRHDATLVVNTSRIAFATDRALVVNFCAAEFGPVESVRRYWRLSRLLRDPATRERIVSVAAPHPHNLLSNEFILAASSHAVMIYEDGTANYCRSNNVGRLKLQSRKKQRMGRLLGFPYRDYQGHVTGIDQRVMDRGCFLSPDNVYQAKRFKHLHKIDLGHLATQGKPSLNYQRVLLLDQDVESLLGPDAGRRLRAKMRDYLLGLGAEVYLKPHPTQRGAQAAERLGLRDVELVNDDRPAELLARELRPGYVASFFSSALKNMGALLPGVRCVSVGVRELDQAHGTGLATVFEVFGVEIL